MNTKITIKIHGCEHGTEVSEETSLSDMIEAYEHLLRTAGYSFDGKLSLVDTECECEACTDRRRQAYEASCPCSDCSTEPGSDIYDCLYKCRKMLSCRKTF